MTLRQRIIVAYTRFDNISILYAKDGKVPASNVDKLVECLRKMRPVSSTSVEVAV